MYLHHESNCITLMNNMRCRYKWRMESPVNLHRRVSRYRLFPYTARLSIVAGQYADSTHVDVIVFGFISVDLRTLLAS
jgi:hypothetical protein